MFWYKCKLNKTRTFVLCLSYTTIKWIITIITTIKWIITTIKWIIMHFNNTSIYSLTPSYLQILTFMLNLMMMMMPPILLVEVRKNIQNNMRERLWLSSRMLYSPYCWLWQMCQCQFRYHENCKVKWSRIERWLSLDCLLGAIREFWDDWRFAINLLKIIQTLQVGCVSQNPQDLLLIMGAEILKIDASNSEQFPKN